MLDPQSHIALKAEIHRQIDRDLGVLESLRNEILPLRATVRRILPRTTTSISLVGTDGGNNRIQFDPFLVHLVRVVDSSNNGYCLEAITPTTNVTEQSRKQFKENGEPLTPLGRLMEFLGVRDLTKLSHMIRRNDDDRPTSPSWVQVYRELMEWASVIWHPKRKGIRSDTDTIIVHDGLLRSKVFAGDLFNRLSQGFREGIERHWKVNRRRIYLVGVG